eukprot:NODE_24583_length_618_cov_39.533605.p7 GENE.NODE_24583_length_618_cov_39.533605~~NODE_24583_length_618_cov_39.533605.p7  ORF type:complete len:53 (-),score=2.53 NODE_24583_length_618_cov_39.533605:403-561(-)
MRMVSHAHHISAASTVHAIGPAPNLPSGPMHGCPQYGALSLLGIWSWPDGHV